jgi:hypothetical protein
MKRTLRALLLLVGVVGTFAYASTPKVHPSGPFPCDIFKNPNCTN